MVENLITWLILSSFLGTPPTEAHFMMQALLHGHYVNKGGGFYPVGGASEIAFNIIPIVRKIITHNKIGYFSKSYFRSNAQVAQFWSEPQ